MTDVSIKDYVDAKNRGLKQMFGLGMVALVGLAFVVDTKNGRAINVFAKSIDELLRLHNDLIRSGERKAAELSATMATKAQVAPLETYVAGEQASSVTKGRVWTIGLAVAAIAFPGGFAIAQLFQ